VKARLRTTLAILIVVTLLANGFSFIMFLRLADLAGQSSPPLITEAEAMRNWMIAVIIIAAAIGLGAFVHFARLLLGFLGGEPQQVA
jgi:uncharacterized membrane protein